MHQKNKLIFLILVPFLGINYILYFAQIWFSTPLLENNLTKIIILFTLPALFLIIYLLKLKYVIEKTDFISKLKQFFYKISFENKIHHHIEINQINLDNFLILIIITLPFILLTQTFNFQSLPIISLVISSMFIIAVSLRTSQKLIEESSKRQTRIKKLEQILEEQIKNSPQDLENLINIEIEEIELILLTNLPLVKFPWISLIFSVLPPLLAYFFNFSLI